MKTMFSFQFLLILVLFVPLESRAQETNAKRIARGKYLVEEVAMCYECHTPLNQRGEPDRTRWLQGATLSIQPVRPNPNWALASPDIAGLPGWADADAVRFFQTGFDSSGKQARPPMHPYRLPREDAEAIVAYLKTLRSGRQGSGR